MTFRFSTGAAAALGLSLLAAILPFKPHLGISPAAAAEKAQSIVAVGGSITEIIYALGEQDRLVARDTTSTFPSAAQDLPDVGYIRALSPEGVLSVAPDMIVLLEGSGPPETVELLKSAGIAIRDIPETYSADGISQKIAAVGAALGTPDKAGALIAQVEQQLADAKSEIGSKAKETRVLFVLSTQGGRILAAGADTAANGIISLAGAQNAITGFSGYKPLSDEAILNAAPDAILMMDRAGDHQGADIFEFPAVAATPAGEHRRIIRMDGQYLLGFGPRTADAICDLAKALSDLQAAENTQ
ncbi:iron complex transport system substrate-binding protein [Roseibium hamelinense]|uniref:Iron complex transport system substrate-binding protein n=1 Tax=Roseibium hamelinense TaxID=150831 RepID=A0A562TBE2_9HYPH|nr:ABC transporter substrate-binding protein [Roseibium hamelinense]MTI45535.1 hemin ABC transporter substrate-binding protein [Roseibium hamelinense]TWI90090.1 iron complex transport system substrate-binding protein [Roseibium hamelinense]